MTNPETPEPAEKPSANRPSFARILQSTLAGAFGVQSNKNRAEDFKNGSIWVFVASGIIFTALFILTITTLAKVLVSA